MANSGDVSHGDKVNRGDAYALLSVRLGELRADGYAALRSRVGLPPTSATVRLHGEPVVVDVDVVWADHHRRKLRVRATALGPSTWTMERLDESFVLGPDGVGG